MTLIEALLGSLAALGTALSGILAPLVPDGPLSSRELEESPVVIGALTAEGADRYDVLTADGVTAVAAAPTNEGGNSRMVLWRDREPITRDHQSCATWDDVGIDGRQPGAALRVVTRGSGVRAITVTKNVFGMGYWVFNVHTMDSSFGATVKDNIAQFNLDRAFLRGEELVPPPWRMCARVIGDEVSFKVWPLEMPEPAWGDPVYGGSVTLPAGWDEPGRPGLYIGHLAPGNDARFSDLTTAGTQ